jgi:hypothetical protein
MPAVLKNLVSAPKRVTPHPNAKDLAGRRFGKLLVVADSGSRNAHRQVVWRCQCDCGNIALRVSSSLIAEKTVSCGCSVYTAENNSKRAPKQKPEAAMNKTYRAYFYGARARSLPFNLNREEFEELVLSDCVYCGMPPSMIKRTAFVSETLNGIDRVDNAIGYDLSNCVPCCRVCNQMKHALGREEFLEHVRRIAAHVN